MIHNKPPLRKIILSSSSYESEPNITSDAENIPTNSNLNQQINDYSYEYEYSDSSDFNIPQIKPSTQTNKIQQNTNKSIITLNRNITPIRPSPKPMIIESKSDSYEQDENSAFNQVNTQSTDEQPEGIQIKSTQQERELSNEINETISIGENSSNNIITTENDDEQNNSITAPNQVEQNNDNSKYYNSYFCSKMNLKSPIDFTFSQKNSSILYAISKGIFSNHVYISSNGNFNIKSIKEKQYEYVMKITKNRSHFELRRGTDKNSLLTMVFGNDYGDELGPRKIKMEWPNQQLIYLSRIPIKTENGNWELNFNGKYVLASQKNAIILDENSKPVIMIRKVQKTILQIEVIHCIEPIYLFALGIASFICPF